MELTNEFRVGVSVEEAWRVLTDVERIAPCMPGAQLQEIEGDEYRGVVKVKVGPITAQYRGAATFQEQDEAGHRAVLRAEGRETRGQGNASATITATLQPDGDGTAVTVVTDLTITGRVAQFGRGVLADVSSKLLNQFVECLESTVLSGEAEPATATAADVAAATGGAASGNGKAASSGQESAAATEIPSGVTTATAPAPSDPTGGAMPESAPATSATPPTPGVRRVEHPQAQPVDLVSTAGAPLAKRMAPLVALLLGVLLLRRWRRRRG
jgi:carbon monoxide dehydrogenase subunit G